MNNQGKKIPPKGIAILAFINIAISVTSIMLFIFNGCSSYTTNFHTNTWITYTGLIFVSWIHSIIFNQGIRFYHELQRLKHTVEELTLFLSLNASLLFLSYWTYTLEISYALVSLVFYLISLGAYSATFWSKIYYSHIEDKPHIKDFSPQALNFLIVLDVLWFGVYIGLLFVSCLNSVQVYNQSVNRPTNCL